MKLKVFGPFIIVLLSVNSLAAVKSKKQSKVKVSFDASYEYKRSENLDSLSDIESLNKDGTTSIIGAELYLKSKIGKVRVKSKTQITVESLINNLYQNQDVVNEGNLDLDERKSIFSQNIGGSYKLNKKFNMSADLEFEKTVGYFVVTKLQILPDGTISKDIEYNILNAKSEKIGATLSGKYKTSRKLTFYGIYRFNEYYNTDQYTFAGDQGTNDRRINSAGVMARYKASKKLKLSTDIQATQTLYKNRLTTLENGGFNRNGIVDRATYFDTRMGLGAKYTFVSIDFDKSQRRDESGGGDGNNSLGAKLGLDYNVNQITLSGEYSRTVRTYTTQTTTVGSDNREDNGSAVTLKVGYKLSKTFKAIASLVRSRSDSNNVFGQNNGQTIGLRVAGAF